MRRREFLRLAGGTLAMWPVAAWAQQAKRNPDTVPHYHVYLGPFEAAAPKLGFTSIPIPVRNGSELEAAITMLASGQDGGFVAMPDIFISSNRKSIIALAARYGVPGIYPYPYMARDGGLASYGIDTVHQFRQSASYVDRILRGERPEDLPIQQPTKFEMTINLKTATALGITLPSILLSTADEVIE